MGGDGITDHRATRGSAFCAAVLACWSTMQRLDPDIDAIDLAAPDVFGDPATATKFRKEYELLRSTRAMVERAALLDKNMHIVTSVSAY